MTRPTRVVTAAVVAFATALLTLGSVTPASATAYRFWTYWSGTGGSWSYSSVGPTRITPDGAVEGWRFQVSQDSRGSKPPRAAASFEAICGSTPTPEPGTGKRVAVVLDYGVSGDAPSGNAPPRNGARGFCAVLPVKANGYAALAQGAGLRTDDSGLVCGVDGYPARGCGEPVSAPAPAATSAKPAATAKATSQAPAKTTPRATVPPGATSTTAPRTTPTGTSPASSSPAAPTGGPTGAQTPAGTGGPTNGPAATGLSQGPTTASSPPPTNPGASGGTPTESSVVTGSPADAPSAAPSLALGDGARPSDAAPGGGALGLASGAALVVLLGGGAVLLARQRRQQP